MRVAIQNPFFGKQVAETELAQRFSWAAQNLGWEVAAVEKAADLNDFQPDFAIALHNNSPKLAAFPTYGCLWNPLSFFEGTEKYVKHVLSYDGYLTSSKTVDRWLHQILYSTPKTYFTAPFYTSCPKTHYRSPDLTQPQLMYLGSNWDGARFQALFEGLDAQPYMQVHGNPDGWKHLRQSYRGGLPYDGTSVLQALHQAGVGLCLHRSEHRRDGLPSMRIFEIVASGAVAICGEHPFIREQFGDSVLYFDPDASEAEQIDRISEQMHWIQQNPQAALEKSARAHQIFLDRFSLEKLLLDLVPHHRELCRKKGFVAIAEKPAPTIQWIIHHSDPAVLQNQLQQIAQQSYGRHEVIVIKPHLAAEEVGDVKDAAVPVMSLSASLQERSSYIWKGLNAVNADYFAVLDETVLIHPNHAQTLVSLLEKHPEFDVAYSGCLHPDETISFQPFNLEQLLAFEWVPPLSSVIARRSLLDDSLLQDPQLNDCVDLCLLLQLAQRSRFCFSYELTCELTCEQVAPIALHQDIHNLSNELSRLRFIFWHQEFAPGLTLQSVHKNQRERSQLKTQVQQLRSQLNQLRESARLDQAQLQTAHAQIEAMKTSKFWKLRSTWFKLKQAIGLPTDSP